MSSPNRRFSLNAAIEPPVTPNNVPSVAAPATEDKNTAPVATVPPIPIVVSAAPIRGAARPDKFKILFFYGRKLPPVNPIAKAPPTDAPIIFRYFDLRLFGLSDGAIEFSVGETNSLILYCSHK